MKNLFKLTDAKIIILILLFFVGGFVGCQIAMAGKPDKEVENFTGISAAGFTYNNGDRTGTIVNH